MNKLVALLILCVVCAILKAAVVTHGGAVVHEWVRG